MGLFSKFFGGTKRTNPLDDKPDLYGGDGSSPAQAVVVNCAHMSMANHLIDRYISERHGQKDVNWERELEMFDDSPNIPEFTVRMIVVKCSDGTLLNYYFNISRPMSATKNLAKMTGAWPKDID